MSHHLLIIDDEEDIRELLHAMFTSAGYRVTLAGTSAEALRVVHSDPPRLVITDLQLGESDGFEVVEQIKAVISTLPVIMLTGVIMDPAEIPPAIREKIACYIAKTTPLEGILREVQRLTK
jgi:DNA-binding NtrC family response regulator